MQSVKTTLPISRVRRDIFQITSHVQKPGVTYTVTENGRPTAVIISADEFESLIETLEIMHEYPDVVNEIKKARKDYERGRFVTLDELFPKKTYVPSPRPSKRTKSSAKRTRSR